MISKKALVAAFVGLVFVVGGTATVLESFGTISGTADVSPALEIVEVGNTSSDSEAYVMIDAQSPSDVQVSEVDIADSEAGSWDPLSDGGEFISSGSTVIVTGDEVNSSEVQGWFAEDIVHFTSGDSAVGGGLDGRTDSGDTVRLNISGNTVDTFSYGGANS